MENINFNVLPPDKSPPIPALEIHKLTVFRGSQKIVGPLSLAVFPGEIFGIFGPNECGKTTLLKAAGNLLPLKNGPITWFGRPSLAHAPEQLFRRIGQQIQSTPVITDLTVDEQLRLLGRVRLQTPRELPIWIDRMYGAFPQLYKRRRTRAANLNGGHRGLLSVASALVGLTNGLLLLDEPTNNLSPKAAEALSQTVIQNAETHNNAVLIVSHDFKWLKAVQNRGILNFGSRSFKIGRASCRERV